MLLISQMDDLPEMMKETKISQQSINYQESLYQEEGTREDKDLQKLKLERLYLLHKKEKARRS